MKIISHRGYWKNHSEKNKKISFDRSFELGFGIETDIRDHMGRLVISHDVPTGSESDMSELVSLFKGNNLLLALNVKSDGLAPLIKEMMGGRDPSSWFVFDMSIPDMRCHLKLGNPVFARMSEVESYPPWFDTVSGIWLDSFDRDWYKIDLIQDLLTQGKRVCIVSPELHGRDPANLWTELLPIAENNSLILCTDTPEYAHYFFCESIK